MEQFLNQMHILFITEVYMPMVPYWTKSWFLYSVPRTVILVKTA